MVEPGVAPAVGSRKPGPGVLRVTVRPNYVGLPSVAGRGPDERRRKPPGSWTQRGPSGPGSYGPEATSPTMERCEAGTPASRSAASFDEGRQLKGSASWRSVSLGPAPGASKVPKGFRVAV